MSNYTFPPSFNLLIWDTHRSVELVSLNLKLNHFVAITTLYSAKEYADQSREKKLENPWFFKFWRCVNFVFRLSSSVTSLKHIAPHFIALIIWSNLSGKRYTMIKAKNRAKKTFNTRRFIFFVENANNIESFWHQYVTKINQKDIKKQSKYSVHRTCGIMGPTWFYF